MTVGRWRDHADRAVQRPDPPGPGDPAFYGPIGDFQGAAYRRNAFAAGTVAEVDALWSRCGLAPGLHVLDVGCGDGRHLRELARRGCTGLGVDVSEGLIGAAREAAATPEVDGRLRFVRHDARDLAAVAPPGGADVALSLSQGAVGTSPATDPAVVAAIAAAVRPGGRVAVTFFHALFAARHLTPGDALDPVDLVHHHEAEVRGEDGGRRSFDLWTSAYTAREAAGLLEGAGCTVREVAGCEPGRYDADQVRLDDPELLVIATKR